MDMWLRRDCIASEWNSLQNIATGVTVNAYEEVPM